MSTNHTHNSRGRNASKVTAVTSLPARHCTAPTQATDLRVGTCCRMGSRVSEGTHIHVRVSCCWKRHSSKLQSSTFGSRAIRRSFLKARCAVASAWPTIGRGLRQRSPIFTEQALAFVLRPPLQLYSGGSAPPASRKFSASATEGRQVISYHHQFRRGYGGQLRVSVSCSAVDRAHSSIFLRKLAGLMSVHTSSMYVRHSSLLPRGPTAHQPAGTAFHSGHKEYCSSSLMRMMKDCLLLSVSVAIHTPY